MSGDLRPKRVWDIIWKDSDRERNAAAGYDQWMKVGAILDYGDGMIKVHIQPHAPLAFVGDIASRKGAWCLAKPAEKKDQG